MSEQRVNQRLHELRRQLERTGSEFPGSDLEMFFTLLDEATERERVLMAALKWAFPREDPWEWHPVGPTHGRFCYSCGWADSGHNEHCDWLVAHKALRKVRALEE